MTVCRLCAEYLTGISPELRKKLHREYHTKSDAVPTKTTSDNVEIDHIFLD